MQIFVRTLTQKVLTIDIQPCDKIFKIKEQIEMKEQIPTCHQILFFKERFLNDDMTLEESNIKKEDCITLSLRLRGC